MKALYRKSCILLLVVTLIFVSTITMNVRPSYACDSKDLSVNAVLELIGVKDVTPRSVAIVNGKAHELYSVQCGDVTNNVGVWIDDESGSFFMYAEENGKTDLLEIEADGTVMLDGKPVLVDRGSGFQPLRVQTSLRSAGSSVYYTSYCPYGSASNYSYFKRNENVASVAFNQKANEIATVIFCNIIGLALNGGWAAIYSFLSGWFNVILTENPTTQYASYKASVYTHSSYHSGYIPSLFTFVEKYNFTGYTLKNYGAQIAITS